MNRQDFFNTVTLQVESLFELASIQADKCFDANKFNKIMPADTFAALERVVLTGCGDSYSAAGAMRMTFANLSGIPMTFSPDPMDFTRFWTDDEICGKDGRKALVVAISASGGSARIVEMMERGKAAGGRTMLISNNPQSKGALKADVCYNVETPELCNTPGLRSYFASMIAIIALGAHIGVCKGKLSSADFNNIKLALTSYVLAYQPLFAEMDELTFKLSEEWKSFERFDLIGDGPEFFSAQFVEEKIIECGGSHCAHADSEDWCHIGFHQKEHETVGTMIHVFKDMPSYGRLVETANSAAKLGRPVLIVSDAPNAGFDARATVCTVPAPPVGFEWLVTLMSFVPGSLMSGYCAALAGKKFFSGRYDFREQKWNVSFE